MKYEELTPEQRVFILKANGKQLRDLAYQWDITERTLRNWRQKTRNEHIEHPEKDITTIQEIYSAYKRMDSHIYFTPKEKHGWIALGFCGDWHLENINTDINALSRTIDTIVEIPHFYYGFTGDGMDNFIGGLAYGQYEATLPPRLGRKVFLKFLSKSRDKLIAMLSGDHEWFAEVQADLDIIGDFAEHLNVAYLGRGGDITIQANGFTYEVHMRHRFRFNSSYNPLHTCRQYLRFVDANKDIVVVAHNHISAISIEEFQNKPRVLVRSGTFKLTDRYADKKSYAPKTHPDRLPVVFLNLDRKEMRIGFSLEEVRDFYK